MLRALCISLISLFCVQHADSQCTISAKRKVCLKDLVTFTISNSSGAVSSYDWNFGPAGNSINTSPIVQFTSTGKVIVKCTLTLVGGGTCIDTHAIEIQPLPKARMVYDFVNSDSCQATNKVCLKNQSIKGVSGFASFNLLWDDGDLTSGKAPFTSNWCHTYADTGTYDASLEIKDSAGCIDVFKMVVHVVPSVVASGYTSVSFGCDSSLLCFNGSATGGKTLNYNWFHLTSGKFLATGNNYCAKYLHGQMVNNLFVATNEYGCFDTLHSHALAPDSFARFSLSTHRTCLKTLHDEPLEPKCAFPMQWKLNGKNIGFADQCSINTGKPGWNIVTLTSNSPCPSTWKDSFWLSVIRAKAQIYNDFQLNYHDTLFVMDVSKNAPGSRMTRWWNFQDTLFKKTPPDTTWVAMGINKDSNSNITRDSLSKHWYGTKQCPVLVLTVYDSSTNCYADTAIIVYDKEFCLPFVSKRTICLGDPFSFDMSSGLYKYVRKQHYLFPDTNMTGIKDSLIFTGPANEYFYKTKGFKSPIFGRYYGPDTVWTESGGKMKIRLIRPAQGWKVDTFFNQVEVKYRPNPEFKVVKLSSCNPSLARIVFKDTSWLYPYYMKVSWGDDSIIERQNYKDTIVLLDSLEHKYLKPGFYTIIVQLSPKNGCTASFVDEVDFRYRVRFGAPTKCDNKVCFIDSVSETGSKKYWTASGAEGKLYWEFGDSTKDTGFNMCHTYSKPGIYRVKLTATSVRGCTDTFVKTVILGTAFAAIKQQSTPYCAEIRKYFDSSFTAGVADSAKIVKWQWDFGDNTKSVFTRNPVHIYPGGGSYNLRLIVTTNRGCKDTAFRLIKVIGPEINAEIISDSFGCIPLTVKFKNNSKYAGKFIWKFGDQNNTFYSTTKDTSVSFTYRKPGVYYARITGGDSFYNPNTGNTSYCTVTFPDSGAKQMRIVTTAGYHSDMQIPDTICTYDSAQILNLADTTFAKLFKWDMGNGDTLRKPFVNFKYKYGKVGVYTVVLHAIVPGSGTVPCRDTARKSIVVYKVTPDFSMDCGAVKGNSFQFRNKSGLDLNQYTWTMKNPGDTNYTVMGHTKDLLYDFGSSSGSRYICLRFDTGQYCAQKVCKTVNLSSGLFLANVFTPGTKDGLNDTYRVPLYGFEDYDLRIFNRWGEKIFNSTDPYMEWNGRVFNTGAELPSGTYFYQLKYRDPCGSGNSQVKTMSGSINLIR